MLLETINRAGVIAPSDAEAPRVLTAPVLGAGAVAACILLGGGLRPSPLAKRCPCSVLDLMVRPGVTVLNAWCAALAGLGRDAMLPVTVALGEKESAPAVAAGLGQVNVAIDRDLSPFRGPAGAVRDRYAGLDADDTVLVGETARYMTADLGGLVRRHLTEEHDVTIGCNGDGSPAGVYALRKKTLDIVPTIGFMDLKEQWLTAVVASGRRAFVHRFDSGSAFPLRTREQFLDAVLPPGRDDQSASLVSGTAQVVEGAFVSRSVVMRSAVVEHDAVVVRSIVLPGARVEAGAIVVDSVVAAAAPMDRGEHERIRRAARPFPFGFLRRSKSVEFG